MSKIKQNIISREIERIFKALLVKGCEHTKKKLKVINRDLLLHFEKKTRKFDSAFTTDNILKNG